ncbi:MAG: hypothetical protein EXQ63_07325 [Ilumatobacteraceae bacterium]|nr:hypothetical protein [Ilumatobacteraceae bacterium]
MTQSTQTTAPCVAVLNAQSFASSRDDGASLILQTRLFLTDANNHQITHLVFVSSAMVYGAWENNTVPLTEDAPVRPDPEFGMVCAFAVAESLVEDWRRAVSGRSTTILRPVPIVTRGATSSLVAALAQAAGSEMSLSLPAAQFMHSSDLDSAIEMCREKCPDGVFNVSPDGAISGERLRKLAARPLQLRLPHFAVGWVDGIRWRAERGPIPPGLRSYSRFSWVVSNDRLKQLGWIPQVTNEEAYVEGTEGSFFGGLSAKRRQEIGLIASVMVVVGAVAVLWRLLRHLSRHKNIG